MLYDAAVFLFTNNMTLATCFVVLAAVELFSSRHFATAAIVYLLGLFAIAIARVQLGLV